MDKILALAVEHPAWGCYRLSDMLKLQGISVSGPTIQNILAKHGMGTKFDRLLKLEERAATQPIELSSDKSP